MLPWLLLGPIGALGSLIVSALSDDDKPSSSSRADEERRRSEAAAEEERRREVAARERRRREHEEKLAAACTLFEEKGANIGDQLRAALSGVIHLAPGPHPFRARLGRQDLAIQRSDDSRAHAVSHKLRAAFPNGNPEVDGIVANLKFHARVYDVQMFIHSEFQPKLVALEQIETELVKLDDIEKQLRALKHRLAT